MELTATQRRIDYVLSRLYEIAPTIAASHDELAVPLQDLFCHAVRSLLNETAAATHRPPTQDDQ